jgi:LPS sulfotransferase NodH
MKANMVCRLAAVVGVLGWGGCSSLEYKVREKFGQHKREILVDRVNDAKLSQEAAKEEFVTALARFKSVTGFSGGKLEAKYDELNAQHKRCEDRAGDVRKRIDAVHDVSQALFREWRDELKQYASASLRESSERQLRQTEQSYAQLHRAMQTAARGMAPVLDTFRDQVLFLKHNLNARAIASIGKVSGTLQREIDVLVADMERAIADAHRFITSMQAEPGARTG